MRVAALLAAVLPGARAQNLAPAEPVAQNPVFPRPVLVPLPESTAGVAQPVITLPDWKRNNQPPADFWSNSVDSSSWADVTVGRGGRGGGPRGGGAAAPYAYKANVRIPADFAGRRVILRFEAVSNAAKVWVNGSPIREHWGSMMAWSCDITDQVKPGENASIALSVDDSPKGLAQYVRAGGIQRPVEIFAVPQNYLTRFHVQVDFDKQYRDAVMKVMLGAAIHQGDRLRVKLTLKEAQGNVVPLKNDLVEITKGEPSVVVNVPVAEPLKWDAEHPELYTLEASVIEEGRIQETVARTFGFVKYELSGNQLLVNGQPVKFRGLWGGNSVRAMVDSNINHTRQKWVTEQFLDECDRLGVYVLDENPVDFAKNPVAGDPQFTAQYISLMADLIERDRSHPSVAMWGHDNESQFGDNVTKAYDYIVAEDPARPVQFSWGHEIPPEKPLPYNVFSFHYPSPDMDLAGFGNSPFNSASKIPLRAVKPVMPVLADEYAHLPIYDPEELQRDPNVHNFWGESLKLFWERMRATQGSLGGDIFGLPGGGGVPENWLIKKAYSPVRIEETSPLSNPGAGQPLPITVKNWFDHTNLNEITFHWVIGGENGNVTGPDVRPHGEGVLQLPARQWKNGETIGLQAVRADGLVLDEYKLAVSPPAFSLPRPQGPAPKITEEQNQIVISGADFKLTVSKDWGLITSGIYRGTELLKGGPYLHVLGAPLTDWKARSVTAKTEGDEAVVTIDGSYGEAAQVGFELRVDGGGLLTAKYDLKTFPFTPPPAHPRPWNDSDVGGFREVGLVFRLTGAVDRLAWQRKGIWSAYPADHIGRPEGVAFRAPPAGGDATWAQRESVASRTAGPGGMRLSPEETATAAGIGTNDFRGSKESIYTASAIAGDSGPALQALSNATDAVRLEVAGREPGADVWMYVNNQWNYPQLGNSNYMKPPIIVGPGYANTVRLRFTRESAR